MDQTTRNRIRTFLNDVKGLPNESAKTHRFAQLVTELFPGTKAPIELVQGVEKRVRIDLGDRSKTGRIDSYYGNAVIEFENSLSATGAHAESQLREYTAGVWAERYRPLVCIASDGITWRIYHPRLKPGSRGIPKPKDVELDLIREIVLRQDEGVLHGFWIWLTSVLFRPSRTEPTAERFAFDFSVESTAFADARSALEQAWRRVSREKEPQTAIDTWRRYLAVTYGQIPGGGGKKLEALFLKHTYLASVARLLIWAALSRGKLKGKTLRAIAADVLSGEYFRSQRIDNLVENDFFQWVRRRRAEEILAPVWERTLDQLLTYDLAGLNQDILKGVYQQLVDPEDRHDLGEYYTPDWLCERIVSELLPESGYPSVLDPTCGSGSFLRAAIDHLLRANPSGGTATRLRKVLDAVVGIDIHPLAVTISKATYLLAIRDLVRSATRPIHVPVYLADALFLPTEVRQLPLGGGAPTYEIKFGKNKKVDIPEELVATPELFDPAVAASAAVAADHAQSGDESEKSLRAYLKREVPSLFDHYRVNEMVHSLWIFADELADLVRKEEDSIWAFVVQNAYRPAMLRERFDFIIGNPPWLSYRYIADPEYQAEVSKRAVDDYGVAPKSHKLRTQMELATVVLVHALTTFGKMGASLGFVMPRSVLSGDQHENIRLRLYKGPVNIRAYWDLLGVSPIFKVPSCVLFAKKEIIGEKQTQTYRPTAVEWSGTLGRRDSTWLEAKPRLSSSEGKARVIWLGSRNALSTKKGRTLPNDPSLYLPRFHQGATLVPRSFYFVSADLPSPIDRDGLYYATSHPTQVEEAKEPYKGIVMSGEVEGRFFFSTALSKHVLPFVLLDPPALVLPAEIAGRRFEMRSARALRAAGYRHFAKWVTRAEAIWKEAREAKNRSVPPTATEWLDWEGKLTGQDPFARFIVLYNAAGTNLAAVLIDRETIGLPFVVDHKLYHCAVEGEDEGHYLAAILNSESVNDEIKPFQSHGLLGERDIHKKVLELPIPLYDSKTPLHQEISTLGRRAVKAATTVLGAGELPSRLGDRRATIRRGISDTLQEINDAVGKLF